MNQEDTELKEIAEYVYENVFLKYTMKQWGKTPKEIDPSVSGRVPVLVSHDNRYFQDTYQGMPIPGYTELFEKMLDFPGIDIRLNCQAKEVLAIQPEAEDKILFEENPETTIMREYPMPYEAMDGQIPYYAINNKENDALYEKYVSYVKEVPNFHLLGRLAEYKYYNIDAIVERALDFAQEI